MDHYGVHYPFTWLVFAEHDAEKARLVIYCLVLLENDKMERRFFMIVMVCYDEGHFIRENLNHHKKSAFHFREFLIITIEPGINLVAQCVSYIINPYWHKFFYRGPVALCHLIPPSIHNRLIN
jgi:hypothetical protein